MCCSDLNRFDGFKYGKTINGRCKKLWFLEAGWGPKKQDILGKDGVIRKDLKEWNLTDIVNRGGSEQIRTEKEQVGLGTEGGDLVLQ